MQMTATLRYTDRPRDPRVVHLATWLLWWHYGRQALRLGMLVRTVMTSIAYWAAAVIAVMSR